MTKADEFLKLDSLINEPDVNKAIEENALTEDPQTFSYEVKEEVTTIKEFNAKDLPLYFKDTHTYNWYKQYFKVSIKNGKLNIDKITTITGSHNEVLQYSFGSAKMDEAFHKENIKITEEIWNELKINLVKYINNESI